jgi:hypothetical protein
MGYDWDTYEKTEYIGEENIKEDIWTSGTAKNTENKIDQKLRKPHKDLDILANLEIMCTVHFYKFFC